MSNILCTGSAGFIGSHLADELISKGHRVLVMDDLSGGYRENVPDKAVFCPGSILDVALIEKLFHAYRFDYVCHLGAYAAEGLSHFIKNFNYQNNLIGSINLINASVNHGVKCFLFTSSMAVYGSGQVPFREDMNPEPEDSYGIAKLTVERELAITKRMFGMDYIVFRPHNVYGERQNIADKYRNVVGIFMNQLLKGEPMRIFGDGEQKRAFTYISDVIYYMAYALTDKRMYNQVFNVGAETPYTINELSVMVANAMGVFPQVEYLKTRDEVRLAYCDHEKIKSYGVSILPTPLKVGINAMAKWVKSHGARESKPFENIEIEKNLPPSWVKAKATFV